MFEESITTETDQSEFTQKSWVYVNDNNAQNYSSQVVIDSTPLRNAGGYVNWSEGYILMPLVVEATATAGLEKDAEKVKDDVAPRMKKATEAFKKFDGLQIDTSKGKPKNISR